MSDPILLLKLLLLLFFANGTPVFVARIMKERLATPLDGGLRLRDRQPLFGNSKTIRGIVSSVLATSAAGAILGLGWGAGAAFAAAAMAGDLTSSFLKRRLGFKVHAQVFGLDQIPEALFPLLVLKSRLDLNLVDVAAIVAVFLLYELLFSRLLYRLHLRPRPF